MVPAEQNDPPTIPNQGIEVMLNQTVTTVPMQPLPLQPNGAVQGTVAWSLIPGPATTNSSQWQQHLPQQQYS